MTRRIPPKDHYAGEPANRGISHVSYWNPVLRDHYCHACGDNWPCLPHRQANPGGSGAVSVDPGVLMEMTDEERMALPAVEHLPHFDGLGTPHTWICRVCWGDGWTKGWPCGPAIKGGVEIAKRMGVGWSW